LFCRSFDHGETNKGQHKFNAGGIKSRIDKGTGSKPEKKEKGETFAQPNKRVVVEDEPGAQNDFVGE
jgi:hypothetical protein